MISSLRNLLTSPSSREPYAFRFGGCPMRPLSATQGVAITGAPGSGKTVLKNEMTTPILEWIASGDPESPWKRAIIYAHKPREVLRHLRHIGITDQQMVVFHPGRLDCATLDESADFRGEDGMYDLAKYLVPEDPKSSEPFWARACALLLSGVGSTFQRTAKGPWFSDDLLYAVSDQERLRFVLEQWEGNRGLIETFFGAEVERTRQNVLFTLETHAKTLRVSAKQLKAARKRGKRPFSFTRDWMGAGPRIVVVCHATTYAKSWGTTYVPLIIETAIRAFKDLSEHLPGRPALSVFDLDEFVQLRLSDPGEFFATARELGGVPIVAIQSEPLLHSVYGEDLGRGVLSNLSLIAHGTTNDPETAASASAQFGDAEYERIPKQWGHEPLVFQEPRVPKDAFLRENNPRSLRFYCRAPGIEKWRYEIKLDDVRRRAPTPGQDELDEERTLRAPAVDFEPWTEEDMERLGLSRPKSDGKGWPAFLDPNANWRSGR